MRRSLDWECLWNLCCCCCCWCCWSVLSWSCWVHRYSCRKEAQATSEQFFAYPPLFCSPVVASKCPEQKTGLIIIRNIYCFQEMNTKEEIQEPMIIIYVKSIYKFGCILFIAWSIHTIRLHYAILGFQGHEKLYQAEAGTRTGTRNLVLNP